MESVRLKLQKFHRRNLLFGYYPGSLKSAGTFVLASASLSYFAHSDILGLQHTIRLILGIQDSGNFNASIAGLAGLFLWFVLCLLRKLVLRRVLLYHGWMYERGKPSLKTKLFALTLRVLNGWTKPLSKQLYGLQGILPALPLPDLKATVKQYVESMKPLVDEKKYAELEKAGNNFVRNAGPKLQRYLKLKYWFSPNYVSDWWEEYVYLMQRSSLLVSSNYYAMDALNEVNYNQAARAAMMAYMSTELLHRIKSNTLEPLLGQGMIPFCNWQYERCYSTCRIPGETVDKLEHYENSGHVVAYHKGKYFKIEMYHDRARKIRLTPAEVQLQFERIMKDDSEPAEGEMKLAALTAWDRPNWAKARKTYFSSGVNRESLTAIETSIIPVSLDEEDFSVEYSNEFKKGGAPIDNFAKKLMCGNGHNRWIDKSVSLIVGTNGRCGAMGEHSWGDGSVTGHLWEIALEFSDKFKELDKNGRITTPIKTTPPPPQRLKWDIPKECIECMDTSIALAKTITDNIDQRIVGFESFGKGFMKKCKVSPDAFVQMALQLAFYRDQGKFEATYEPSITRLFLQGRTETIRSCTTESCKFVLSMGDSNVSRQERIKYFQEACERHARSFRQSMVGKNCDRHLFALYVVSKYLKVESPFLQEALSRPWRLSTTQAPFSQIQSETLIWLAAGFGTVAADGYGISYIFIRDGYMFFHVSSMYSCPETDSIRFSQAIQRALLDIQELFSPEAQSA